MGVQSTLLMFLSSSSLRPVVYTDFTATNSLTLNPRLYSYSTTDLRTITDATGAITYAPNNLLTYSNTLTNGSWTQVNASVTTSSIPSPNNNLFQVTNSTGSTQQARVQQILYCPGNTFISAYAQAGNTNYCYLQIAGASGGGYQVFNLSNGTLGTGGAVIASGISAVNSYTGLYYVWAIFPPTTQNTQPCIGPASSASTLNSTNGQYIYSGSATMSAVTYETTPRPGDQVITTSAAYYGPAFDFDPITHAPLGLRAEGTRTNIFLNSNAPATQTITVTSGQSYTVSFYGTGTLTLSGALTQVVTGGGAYPTRTTYTGTAATTSLIATVTTLGTMGYVQLELGTFPSSYIPTTTAAATRAADVVALAGKLAAALKAPIVSVVAEYANVLNVNSSGRILSDNFNQAYLGPNSGPNNVGSFVNGVSLLITTSVNQTNSVARAGTVFTTNSTMTTGVGYPPISNAVPKQTATTLYLGSNNGNTAAFGYIRKLAVYSKALPARTLQQKTVVGSQLP